VCTVEGYDSERVRLGELTAGIGTEEIPFDEILAALNVDTGSANARV
jgi:hypothetical protein